MPVSTTIADRRWPGQIWLIEQPIRTAAFRVDRDVLTASNVVIYDRALAPLVARFLPIGAYAEPLPRCGVMLPAR